MADSKQIDQALTLDAVKKAFAATMPLMKDAYQRLGSKPDDAVFTAKDAGDLRGAPVWEMENWSERS